MPRGPPESMHFIGIESPTAMQKPVSIKEILEFNEKQLQKIEEKNRVGKADPSEAQGTEGGGLSLRQAAAKINARKEQIEKKESKRERLKNRFK